MGLVLGAMSDAYKGTKSIITLLYGLYVTLNDVLKRAAESPGLPHPKPSYSYWFNDPPFPELVDVQSPSLPETCDVVVIGSGITGAAVTRSLLHNLRRAGRSAERLPSVTVLEARQICSGATGRNGGHIKASPHDSFHRLCKSFPPDRAAALVRFQARHVDCLTELCRAEGIEAAEAREVETVDLFLDHEAFRGAGKQVEECRKWMPEMEAEIWDGEEMRERFGVNKGVVGAISYPAGALWPYRLVTSIWKRLLDDFPDTLTIETNTPVKSITTAAAKGKTSSRPDYPYAIETSRGVIHARHVVHATNAWAGHLVPGLRSRITGARAHMSAQMPGDAFPSQPKGDRSWSVFYHGGGFDYITQRPAAPPADSLPTATVTTSSSSSSGKGKKKASEAGDLMLGGGFTRSPGEGMDQVGVYDDSDRPDALTTTHLFGIFPAIFAPNWGRGAELRQLWSGIIGMTGDLVPFVGRLGEGMTKRSVAGRTRGSRVAGPSSSSDGRADALQEPGEWIAAGYSGEGMVWAWLCGTALGIMMAGTDGGSSSANEDGEEDAAASEEDIPGQPRGLLKDWFPGELRVTRARLRTAHVSNLAEQF